MRGGVLMRRQLYFKVCTQQRINPFKPFVLSNCYRGLTVSCMNMGGLTGLQFWLSGAIQKAITGGEDRALTPTEEMGSALLGGEQAATATPPPVAATAAPAPPMDEMPGVTAKLGQLGWARSEG